MVRATQGNKSYRKHKKVLQKAKGYYGARSRTFRAAAKAVIKASQYSYRDKKNKKRVFRSLWITQINAAAKQHNMNYSTFIKSCKDNSILFNRKVLADIAINSPDSFTNIVNNLK